MSNSNSSNYESDSESIPEEINWSLTVIKNRYIILNKLGSGSYCTVWGIYDVETKNMFALKIYNEEDTDDAMNETNILNEIIEQYTRKLFERGKQLAAKQGLILVDTKYEFGKIDDTIYIFSLLIYG